MLSMVIKLNISYACVSAFYFIDMLSFKNVK